MGESQEETVYRARIDSHYPVGPWGGDRGNGKAEGSGIPPGDGPWGICSRSGVGSRKVGLSCQDWLEFGAGKETMRFQGSIPVSSVDETQQERNTVSRVMAHAILEELRRGRPRWPWRKDRIGQEVWKEGGSAPIEGRWQRVACLRG